MPVASFNTNGKKSVPTKSTNSTAAATADAISVEAENPEYLERY
jgi:hypothetical protein